MTIGLFGRRRNGKSLMATILGLYFAEKNAVKLFSNCEIKGSEKLTAKQLIDAKNCVMVLDEFWRDMDSWDWKNPRSRVMSHWYQLQGHSDVLLIYTTQLLSQMNNRIRESTDYLVYCEKKEEAGEIVFRYTFLDGFSKQVLFVLKGNEAKMRQFYQYYDYVGYVDSLYDDKVEA